MANNEVTYFEMVYVTFPVTWAILADIDILLPGAKGLLFCLFSFFFKSMSCLGETNGGLAVVF